MTYDHEVEATGGQDTDAVELLWAAVATTDDAVMDDEPGAPASDEWADLRQVLAGEDEPEAVDDEDDDPVGWVVDDAAEEEAEVDEVYEDDVEENAEAQDELVPALFARIDELREELAEERAAREALSDRLDRLAQELDVVLGDALAEERARREEIEVVLREVQTTLADAVPAWDGVERRSGEDRRSAAERARGLAPRPLRARGRRATDRVEPEPEAVAEPVEELVAFTDETIEDDVVEEAPSVWKSRLHDVAGSVSSWSADDTERLRVK